MIKYILPFFAFFLTTSAIAQQRSNFRAESGGYYIERQKPNESYKRFFGIGINVHSWPNSKEQCPRYPDELEFTSAKEIFNILNIRYHDGNTNNGCSSTIPTWLTTNGHDEAILLSGSNHTTWSLWRLTSVYNLSHTILGPNDQNTLNTTLQTGGTDHHVVNSVINQVIDFSEANNKVSDLIFWSSDEPDRGFEHWYFDAQSLTPFKQKANDNNLLSYIDLGPVTGNEYLYDLNGYSTPGNNLSTYNFSDEEPTEEATLKNTVSHYENSSEIIGVNSYSTTSLKPFNLGLYTKWIHEEASNKPVLPWISAECPRYGSNNCTGTSINTYYYENIKSQAYSAIINKATGVMFWTERSSGGTVSDETYGQRLDDLLDIAKELQYYSYIIENYTNSYYWVNDNSGTTTPVEELLDVQIGLNYFTFYNDYYPLYNPVSKVTYESDTGPTWDLSYPRNLGFEIDFSSNTNLSGNWKETHPDVYTDLVLERSSSQFKIGAESLHLKDDNDTKRVSVEQWFDIAPCFEYETQGWYYGVSGWQSLIMQFYDGSSWIEEHSIKNNTSNNGEWTLLETTAEAPEDATRIKIHIGTKTNNWNSTLSEGYWDDIMVKMVGGDGDCSTSKINPGRETQKEIHDFNLNQNYPNPFNPSTTISYSIKEQGPVTLKVFNLAGQEVATLVNSNKSPGNHEVVFNSEFLSSGVYFYELKSGNQVLRQKMTLIK